MKAKQFFKKIFKRKNEVEKLLDEISFCELERQKVFNKNKSRNANLDNKMNALQNKMDKIEHAKVDGDKVATERVADLNRTLKKLRKKIQLEKDYYASIGENKRVEGGKDND